MKIGYQAPDTTIWQGNVLDTPWPIESGSVQCCVTSPPYWALRNYQADGQIGLEPTPAEFIAKLVTVFREVRRVLRDDGVAFVNIGDSYAGSGKGPSNSLQRPVSCLNNRQLGAGAAPQEWISVPDGPKQKDLCLIPERLAIALQDDGWWVRSRIAWCKKSAMPESVTDRPTSAWEHIWMLAKSEHYYWDAMAVAEPSVSNHPSGNGYKRPARLSYDGRGQDEQWQPTSTRNLRNWWALGPEPSREQHFACFVSEIPRRAILAGSSEHGACARCGAPRRRVTETERTFESGWGRSGQTSGGKNARMQGGGATLDIRRGPCVHTTTTGWEPTCNCGVEETRPCLVLDPFMGSGTTALVARQLGRRSVGIELNESYVGIIRRRLDGQTLALPLA